MRLGVLFAGDGGLAVVLHGEEAVGGVGTDIFFLDLLVAVHGILNTNFNCFIG